MKIIEIKSEKQNNGLWGMPLSCYKIDRFVLLDDRKWLLRSAIIIAFAEKHKCSFNIYGSTDKGFIINSVFWISYHKYEVVDNLLYEFENEQEHIIFLRKQKINKLDVI